MLATSMATKKPTAKKKPEGRKKSLLAEVGEEARRAAQKKLLLDTLKKLDWNMTATAEALGLAAGSTVIRALIELAPEEYAAAKEAGKVSPANRRE